MYNAKKKGHSLSHDPSAKMKKVCFNYPGTG